MPKTDIYVDVEDVPVTGISASDRVSVTASAMVNGGSAGNTLVSYSEPSFTLVACLRSIFSFQFSLAEGLSAYSRNFKVLRVALNLIPEPALTSDNDGC